MTSTLLQVHFMRKGGNGDPDLVLVQDLPHSLGFPLDPVLQLLDTLLHVGH